MTVPKEKNSNVILNQMFLMVNQTYVGESVDESYDESDDEIDGASDDIGESDDMNESGDGNNEERENCDIASGGAVRQR